MSYEMRPNSGTLFKNDRKEQDNHPDYRGECLIGGTEYYMSAWLKESKKGTKFMSFSFKPKSETGRQEVQKARAAVQPDFVDDDLDSIPF